MQRTTSQIRRQRWRHALLFGLPLAFLELGITFVVLLHSSQIFGTDLLIHVAIPAYLTPYLIIPLIAGYHFTYHSRNDSANSGWAGLSVGCVSFVLVSFVQTVFAGIAFVDISRSPPGAHNFKALGYYIVIFGAFGLLVLNWVGMLLGALGGLIGGVIGKWRARRVIRAHPQESQG